MLPSIHTLRGNIVHSVLEDFYDVHVNGLTKTNFRKELKGKIQEMLLAYWLKKRKEIKKFGLTKEQEMFYFEETMMMILNWFEKW